MQVDSQIAKGIRQSGVPREEIFITTKFWPHFAAPENVSKSLDQTLEVMQVQYIDLFLAHFPGALKPDGDLTTAKNFIGATAADQKAAVDEKGNYVPDVEHCPKAIAKLNGGDGSFVPTWNAMKALVKSGKCRAIGLSNFTREHIEEILPHALHEDVPISCNQIEAHPWYPNTPLIRFLQSQGIVATIYSPLAPKAFVVGGLVSGDPFKPLGVLLIEEPKVREVARRNKMDVGQVLQSWAVQRGTIPLAKSQNPQRIRTNLTVQRLPDDDYELLNSLEIPGLLGKSVDVNSLFPGLKLRE